MPAHVLRRYEDAESGYSIGWSHGKEVLKSGKKDVLKGETESDPVWACGSARCIAVEG